MSKIYPSVNKYNCNNNLLLLKAKVDDDDEDLRPAMLTVWKRSSMSFQGTDGFTVYDHRGRLVFRVDNYSRNHCCVSNGLILMDGAGNSLLSMKPQILSMQYQWNAYRDEEDSEEGENRRSKVFSIRSTSVFFQSSSKDEAEVFMGGYVKQSQAPDFRIEGSFRTRNCKIRTSSGQLAAKISRKKVNSTILLSDDVFSLVVEPGFDSQLIMAFVIVLDRICNKPFTPVLCS